MVGVMDAIVKAEPGVGLELRKEPLPVLGADDVLIKVQCAGICGTDVHIYQWNDWAQSTIPTPVIVGHEFVGEIVAVGENVHHLSVGDQVSAEGHVVCGQCRNCRTGRFHLCKNESGIGVTRPGAFAEFVAVPKTNVWVHAEGIDPSLMSIFDPFGNATHTARSFPVLGEDVLVTGAGPIGLMAAAIVCHAGARHVVLTDTNDYRLSLANQMDSRIHTVNIASASLSDVMSSLKMTEGFDVGLEMSGAPEALNDIVMSMANGGKIALLGIPSSGTVIDWSKVVFKGLTIQGVYGRKMWETWYMMTSMLQSGLTIAPVITHRFHYTEFERGFEAIFSGQSGKVLLDWS